RMYSGCSASSFSGSTISAPDSFSASCHQTSRPDVIGTCCAASVRLTTSTFLTVGQLSSALSMVSLSGILLPRRQPPSAVVAMVAVVGGIDLRVDEPLCVWRIPLQDAAPRFEPVNGFGLFSPEYLRIGLGAVVDAGVTPIRLGLELLRGRVATILL